jgi:hypothetical protein
VLLGGLGWKLIHGTVRPGQVPLRITSPLIYSILILAALTSTQAFLAGFPLSLRIRA